MGADKLSLPSVNNYQLRNIPEERKSPIYTAAETWNHAVGTRPVVVNWETERKMADIAYFKINFEIYAGNENKLGNVRIT